MPTSVARARGRRPVRQRMPSPSRSRRPPARGVLDVVTLALPGALTVYFGFNAGGFFVGAPALGALITGILLLLRVTTTPRPFAGIGRLYGITVGAFGLYSVWILVSAKWSDAPGRAQVEFDRALFYTLLVALYGLIPRSTSNLRWVLRGVTGGLVILAGAGFVSRALPHVLTVDQSFVSNRLSYPTTYWNATGIAAGLAALLCFVLSTDRAEPAWSRVVASAAFPLACAGLLLTYSRGAIGATVIGFVVYVVVARPWGLFRGAAAALPAGAIAVYFTYRADALSSDNPISAAAVSQGKELAAAIAAAMVIGALIRINMLSRDKIPPRPPFPEEARGLIRAIGAFVVAIVVGIAILLGAPGALSDQYHSFVNGNKVSDSGDVRTRLTEIGNNGRVNNWNVALDAWSTDRLKGVGAGMYQNEWSQHRPSDLEAVDGHSILLEPLAELGIVGFGLLMVGLGGILFAFARRMEHPNRALYGGLLAVGLTWLIHASIDWDWEMPVTATWLFACGGLALAEPVKFPPRGGAGRTPRIVAGLVVLLLGITPLQLMTSQTRLNQAVDAFARGDCQGTINKALESSRAAGDRAEPWELIAYCDARLGQGQLAVAAAKKAIDRDPSDWEYHYDLAVVSAAAGVDPRPAARDALRLNPRSDDAKDIVGRFDTSNPRVWMQRSGGARLLAP